ncbi:MAG: flagellar FliJ family protein [Candidatus Margulisbacteria bacterium]|nr:flagellar FliJ family protein [Candidatus Margulisiibacteriota bacterium]
MKKPKKSKRFEYNLKTVLKVREIYERIEKEKFAEAQRKYLEELEREKKMKEYEMQQQRALKNNLTGSIDFAGVLHRQQFLKKYKVDVNEQENKTKEADQRKEEQRERLVKSMKDRKILDKDKEHKRQAWVKLMNREETKFLDDIATAKYFRVMDEKKREEALEKERARKLGRA